MIWEIGTIAKQLLLPPFVLGWLLVPAWLLIRTRPKVARWLLGVFVAGVLVLSTHLVHSFLIRQVELPSEPSRFGEAQAIVILSGGRRLVYDENGAILDSFVAGFSLERVQAGARIAKKTGLPVLVSSGTPDGKLPTEAEAIRRVLSEDFGVEAKWLEDRSRNTVENAEFTAAMLRPKNIRKVILVTSAFHMRRSKMLFERFGMEVIPLAVNPIPVPPEFDFRSLIPNAPALLGSYYAFNEMGGYVYVLVRARLIPSATVGN